MNELALSPDEIDVLIDEVRVSFRLNTAIFEALSLR
jgi:heme oxygenase (biliverdin-producing, ferredoxin)